MKKLNLIHIQTKDIIVILTYKIYTLNALANNLLLSKNHICLTLQFIGKMCSVNLEFCKEVSKI